MNNSNNSSGFSIGAILIVVLVVAILGLAGYTVVNRQPAPMDTAGTNQTSTQTPTANNVPAAPPVNSTSDLDEAEAVLNSIDLNSDNDSSQLDGELSNF